MQQPGGLCADRCGMPCDLPGISQSGGHYSSYGAYYYVHTGEAYNFHQEYLERVAILSGPEKDVQLPAYQFRPWFLCMGESPRMRTMRPTVLWPCGTIKTV